MFTGIIEEVGHIKEIRKNGLSLQLSIACSKVLEDVKIGDSISSNGVCLTVTQYTKDHFTADLMPETVALSTFSKLNRMCLVNLERAMKASDRFGGHMVAGHIDGRGRIVNILKDENAFRYYISCDNKIMNYVIKKGSIAIDGISLTVTKTDKSGFEVSVIPQTMKETTFSKLKIGDLVNLETDLVGRYIEKFTKKDSGITEGFLEENGFL